MKNNIEAIFLDVGNTLRIVVPDPTFITDAKRQMVELTGTQMSPDDFFDSVGGNAIKYCGSGQSSN